MVNSIPLKDLREHVHDESCWCHPVVEFGDENGIWINGPLIIHRAGDWREEAEKLLGEGLGEHKQWINYHE
jgi:hypothetical protein